MANPITACGADTVIVCDADPIAMCCVDNIFAVCGAENPINVCGARRASILAVLSDTTSDARDTPREGGAQSSLTRTGIARCTKQTRT